MSIKVFPFTNNFIFPDYKNVIRFQSEAHRVAFFSSSSVAGANFSASGSSAYQTINLNWNDGYETTIRINTGNDSTDSASRTLSYNYLHLIEQKESEDPIQYFFFITNAKFINPDVIEYRIVLDVFSTFIQNVSSDQPIMTERRHCQRFARYGTTPDFKWRFRSEDAVLNDELDERFKAMIPETLNTQKLNVEYFTSTSSVPTTIEGYSGSNFRLFVNNLLNSTLWMYAFILIDEDDTNQTGTRLLNTQSWKDSFDVGYRVLVAPIREMFIERVKSSGSTNYVWSAKKLYESIMSDKVNPNAISIRISPIAPFNNRMRFNDGGSTPQIIPSVGEDTIGIKVSTSQANTHADFSFLQVDGSASADERWFMLSGTGSTSSYWGDDTNGLIGLITYSNISDVAENLLNQTYNASMTLPVYTTLPTNTTAKNHNNEPKLKTSPYYRLELMTGYSPIKELNPIHFTSTTTSGYELRFEVNDIPTIADQKYTYAISKSLANPYYANNIDYNKALVGNNLYEFVVRRDKYADYVANHSNYLLTGLGIPTITGAVKTGLQIASGDGRAITSGVDTISNAINFFATMNDLERAPDTIKATGNNILHDFSLNVNLGIKLAPYVLPSEQRDMAFDYFYERGYRVMRESVWRKADASSFPTGFTSGDALFNRSRFNYVKLIDDELLRKLSFSVFINQKARTIFADVLLRGVRMIESSATASTTIANFNTTTENMEYNTTIV